MVGSSRSSTSGARRELTDDREPLPPAAGERVDGDRRIVETGAAERLRDPERRLTSVVHVLGERGLDDLLGAGPGGEGRVLRHVADAREAAERTRPVVRGLEAGEDSEQRRLAAAVRPTTPTRPPSASVSESR